ncbi:MAG: hypothetical protein ACE5HM_05080, partial [Acidiferrobacterales bacterium]
MITLIFNIFCLIARPYIEPNAKTNILVNVSAAMAPHRQKRNGSGVDPRMLFSSAMRVLAT